MSRLAQAARVRRADCNGLVVGASEHLSFCDGHHGRAEPIAANRAGPESNPCAAGFFLFLFFLILFFLFLLFLFLFFLFIFFFLLFFFLILLFIFFFLIADNDGTPNEMWSLGAFVCHGDFARSFIKQH